MFTGLVENTAEIISIENTGEGKRVRMKADEFKDVERGESVSVSGACLTVEGFGNGEAVFFLAEETLDKTWFKELETGDQVNIERALRADDRMGGHIVQGHVEAVGNVIEVEELEEGWNMTFEKPAEIDNYIVNKGFITVEGISLTITEVTEESFSVTIIPETWKITNLSEKKEGDKINLETDIVAKYVEKMI